MDLDKLSKTERAVLLARYDERHRNLVAIEDYIVRAIREIKSVPYIPGDDLGKRLESVLDDAHKIVLGHIHEVAEAMRRLLRC
jgi:hypothetical protein